MSVTIYAYLVDSQYFSQVSGGQMASLPDIFFNRDLTFLEHFLLSNTKGSLGLSFRVVWKSSLILLIKESHLQCSKLEVTMETDQSLEKTCMKLCDTHYNNKRSNKVFLMCFGRRKSI